jgi:hypothetical protein
MRLRLWLRRLILTSIVVTLVTSLCWFWYTHRNYGSIFQDRAGAPIGYERTFLSESNGVRQYDVTIFGRTGLRASARLSIPADLDPPLTPHTAKVPALLLAAGLQTGREAVSLIPPQTNMIVMALDYGWSGEFDISTLSNTKRDMGRLRATTMDAVPRALLALDGLRSEPSVNPDQLIVVGVSYGSYVALPAAALHPDVDELILVQGGARIGPTIAGNTAHWKSSLPAPLAAWIGETIFVPFDPIRWARRIDRQRFTMMASRLDDQMPTAALTDVFDASPSPRKELIWIDAPHVAPKADEIISLLSSNIVEHIKKTYPTTAAP